MVRFVNNEINGLKELQESISEFKLLLGNVFVAVNGCDNTNELSKNLIETYGTILKLEKSLNHL